MEHVITVTVRVKAETSNEAREQVKRQLAESSLQNYHVGSSGYCYVDPKPIISDELACFLTGEIDDNDNDNDGWQTDLDYASSSLEQMPDDIVVVCADYQGEDSDEVFVEKLKAEFDALYDKYGGETPIRSLLDY